MGFNRRGFLIGIIGGAPLATLGGAAFANAPDRYKKLIALQRDILADKELWKAKLCTIAGPEPEYAPRVPSHYDDPAAYEAWRKIATVHEEWSRRCFEAQRTTLKDDLAAYKDTVTVKADNLLDFSMKNFPDNDHNDPALRASVRDLFNGKLRIDTLDEADLRKVEDAVINIALAKTMLAKWKLPLNTAKMRNFDTFADRYKMLILG